MIGFVILEGEWEVTGYVTGGRPATHEDPEDPGEVEITDVRDPDGKLIAQADWPFDDDEHNVLIDRMSELSGEPDYDERDYYSDD